MHIRRRTFLGGAAALIAAPAGAGALVRVGGAGFGSAWRVTAGAGAEPAAISAAVAQVVAAVDAAMSPWRADSELARFNRAPAGALRASPELCRVAQAAVSVAAESGGAFDPTVGPLVRRFGWGPIEGAGSALGAIEVTPNRLVKRGARATLDLCGIAKGHALDRAVEALSALGLRDALVEMGGEVRAIGRHPSGRAWQVAVEAPGGEGLRVQRLVRPGPRALATSGLAPNGYAGRGIAVSHIIDPRTRQPVDGRLEQVTVAAEDAAAADAWATALLVLGPEAGPRLAQDLSLAALFLLRDKLASREVMTADFETMVVA